MGFVYLDGNDRNVIFIPNVEKFFPRERACRHPVLKPGLDSIGQLSSLGDAAWGVLPHCRHPPLAPAARVCPCDDVAGLQVEGGGGKVIAGRRSFQPLGVEPGFCPRREDSLRLVGNPFVPIFSLELTNVGFSPQFWEFCWYWGVMWCRWRGRVGINPFPFARLRRPNN